MRTGLLGGSFNPAHRGHRGVTLAAIRALALDEAWWLVSPSNPLKPGSGMAPLAARLASPDVRVTLIKDGDHRLSRPADLALLSAAILDLLGEGGGEALAVGGVAPA